MTNFYQSLETAFGSRLDTPALILKDRPDWSFQQLVSVVDQFAAVLRVGVREEGGGEQHALNTEGL